MASGYPSSLDTFATTSPTNLGDDDAQARNHAERHDDIGDAMNKVQAELGTSPSGSWSTVASRLDGGYRQLVPGVGEWIGPGTNFASGFTPTQDRLYAAPFFVPYPMTLDRISIYCGTGQSSSVGRLGLYANSSDKPGALILDGGTVDLSSTGQKDLTISQAVSAGLLWIGLAVQTAGGTAMVWQATGYTALVPFTSAMTTDYHCFYKSSVTGALPDPFGTPDGLNESVPYVVVRRGA